MPQSLVKAAAERSNPTDRRMFGVAVGQVVGNLDLEGLGRVQVRLPWLRGLPVWARLASPGGTYFIPQEGEEVLLAFNQGDVREAYVLGTLWNQLDRPLSLLPNDAKTKRIMRSPAGHEIEFDDLTKSISITNTTDQKIEIGLDKIEISAGKGMASISLDAAGNLVITSKASITIDGPNVTVKGSQVGVTGQASTRVGGGAATNVDGAAVSIGQ
jgi:uncharacterized protein involved in type VI secretion and phage assembly